MFSKQKKKSPQLFFADKKLKKNTLIYFMLITGVINLIYVNYKGYKFRNKKRIDKSQIRINTRI